MASQLLSNALPNNEYCFNDKNRSDLSSLQTEFCLLDDLLQDLTFPQYTYTIQYNEGLGQTIHKKLLNLPSHLKVDFAYHFQRGKQVMQLLNKKFFVVPAVIKCDSVVTAFGYPASWSQGSAVQMLQNKWKIVEILFNLQNKDFNLVPYQDSRSKKSPKSASFFLFDNLILGQCSISGTRTYNEDRVTAISDVRAIYGSDVCQAAYFAVYDGHGGEASVDYIRDNLHKRICLSDHFRCGDIKSALHCGFQEVEKHLQQIMLDTHDENDSDSVGNLDIGDVAPLSSGSTACVCIIKGNQLYISNLGDSRCILSRASRSIVLTRDHRVNSNVEEQERVNKSGAYFDDEGYLGGRLAVSRAFGDFDRSTKEKLHGLSALPDIQTFELCREDEFLLLGSDGVFDVMTPQEAVLCAMNSLIADNNPNIAAEALCKLALQRHSLDNLTAVVVVIQSPKAMTTHDISPSRSTATEDVARPRIRVSALKHLAPNLF